MTDTTQDPPPPASKSGAFPPTDWTVVRATGHAETRQQALAKLCQRYWYPVYAFIRRSERRKSADDARDLTQGFFSWLIDAADVTRADPQVGLFRSWLMLQLKFFLSHQYQYEHQKKRNVDRLVWVDALEDEARFRLEPSHRVDPERSFDRDCAVGVLRRGLERLRDEYTARGEREWFEQAKQLLVAGESELRYHDVEQAWGVGANGSRVRVSRLRARLRVLILDELTEQVGAENVEAERQFLLSAIELESQWSLPEPVPAPREPVPASPEPR
jgi:hypothetical protein